MTKRYPAPGGSPRQALPGALKPPVQGTGWRTADRTFRPGRSEHREADRTFRRAPGVASRLVAGEAVLVVPSRREAHVLNGTGSAAWALMDGSLTTGEIASALAGRYGVEGGRASRDLGAFLDDLASRGAAEVVDAPAKGPAPDAELPPVQDYTPPAVAETQPMEVVAALCSSLREGAGGGLGICRAFGGCQKPFE